MRIRSLVLVAVLLSATAACGGGDDTGTDAGAPAATAPAATSPAESPAATSGDEGGAGETLVATVGEEGNPDAFTITLEDSSGQAVTTLAPGTYTVEVADLSAIHNFHLTGPGVEETTTVPEKTEVTWEITVEAGEYTFICDPHPKMKGSFTVA